MRDRPENITVLSRGNAVVLEGILSDKKYDPRNNTKGPLCDDSCDLVDRSPTLEPVGFTICRLASNIRLWIRYRQRSQF